MWDDDEASTVHRPKFAASDAITEWTLVVTEGPDAGARTPLDFSQGPTLIGKSPACAVQLNDREISRRHVSLDRVGNRLRISDLQSTNGTFVDGVAVLDGFVNDGQLVRIGATAFRLEARGGRAAPTAERKSFGRVIGASAAMQRIYPLCARVAATNVAVLIEGETGTGKEQVAESLHEESPRAQGPFVVFDCTAVPPSLLEAELFGHEKGAFTGATATRKGVFEQAHGGTLLIDEIGDLDAPMQPKLLRAIERHEVRRIGGNVAIKVDVRVIAATRRNLDREVQAGRFRDDLFHRLVVARIALPPLRDRRGDVELLARHFLAQMQGDPSLLSSELLARWNEDTWPGNVRSLRNAVARLVALGDLADEPAIADTAIDPIDDILKQKLPFSIAREKALEAFERRYIARILEEHGGNVMRAAAASGIHRRYLQKLKAKRTENR
jgi:DNA-binding NtrC family response regulator